MATRGRPAHRPRTLARRRLRPSLITYRRHTDTITPCPADARRPRPSQLLHGPRVAWLAKAAGGEGGEGGQEGGGGASPAQRRRRGVAAARGRGGQVRVWPGAAQEATPRRSLLSLAPRPPPPANCAESRAQASVAARPRPSPCSCWRACVWAGEVSGRARPGTALLRSPETRAILPPSRPARPTFSPEPRRAPHSPGAAPTKFRSPPRREPSGRGSGQAKGSATSVASASLRCGASIAPAHAPAPPRWAGSHTQ